MVGRRTRSEFQQGRHQNWRSNTAGKRQEQIERTWLDLFLVSPRPFACVSTASPTNTAPDPIVCLYTSPSSLYITCYIRHLQSAMEDFLDHNQQHHHNQDFHSSPFLSDNIELRPPTPPYGYSGSPLPSTAHLPDTPSYAGSFHSPYSAHSDLSFADQQDFSNDFAFLDDPSNPKLLDSSYDPAEYDAPSVGGLLTFDSIDMPHQPGGAPTLTATTYQQVMDPKRSPRLGAFDHSSPSSAGEAGSGSGNEGGGGGDVRSRASSISSNHASYLQQPVQQQQQMASPRLDVSQFENLRFESPHWQSQALPPNHQAYQHQHSPSPALKPQSPPHLFIPPSPPAGAGGPEGVPTINAPDGDGSSAPSLNIVPATPVGGAETARPGSQIPFQQRLDTLTQGQGALTQKFLKD